MLAGDCRWWSSSPSRFRRTVQQSYRRIRVAIARINSYLQEHVNGIAVLQLFNREQRSAARNSTPSIAITWRPIKDAIQAYGWFYPVVEFLGMLALAMLLAYGGFRIRAGRLSLGVLVAFFQYGLRFFRPIQDLSEKYNILQSAMAASERIFKLLDTPAAIGSPPSPHPFPEDPAAVEFDHVWFAYNAEDWVLRDVSFRIEPGETIAVVGHTGAGKTTLTSLLLRFYDIQRGSHQNRRHRIREFALDDLRRHFGSRSAGPLPVHRQRSIPTSAWARNGSSRQAVEEASAQVNLLEFVESLPETIRPAGARARQRIFHRPETTDQLRARAGARSALPDSGRSHLQRRHRNRISRPRRAGPHGRRPHLAGDRASPLHHPARRPDFRHAQRPTCAKAARIRNCSPSAAFIGSCTNFNIKDQEIMAESASFPIGKFSFPHSITTDQRQAVDR